jgi:hypothetical protein
MNLPKTDHWEQVGTTTIPCDEAYQVMFEAMQRRVPCIDGFATLVAYASRNENFVLVVLRSPLK